MAILKYCQNIAAYQIWEESANNFCQESVNNLLFAPVVAEADLNSNHTHCFFVRNEILHILLDYQLYLTLSFIT